MPPSCYAAAAVVVGCSSRVRAESCERAPYSCHQESLFVGEACVCLSAHTEDGRGILNNRNKSRLWRLFISAWSKRHVFVCLCVCVADMCSVANRSANFTWACLVFLPSCFFYRHGIRSPLNVNMLRAGQQGDRETDEGLLKASMCVCVHQLAPGKGPSPLQQVLHLPRTPREPVSQMWSHFTGNPQTPAP